MKTRARVWERNEDEGGRGVMENKAFLFFLFFLTQQTEEEI